MMLRKLLILCLALVCSGSAAAQQRDRGQAATVKADTTVVSIDRTKHDFGQIRRRGDVVTDFVLTNRGTQPLVVVQVVTSCSCLKAEYSRRPVAPGAQTTVRLRYEPHKADPGTFYKVVKIYTNAGRLLVTLQGNSIE